MVGDHQKSRCIKISAPHAIEGRNAGGILELCNRGGGVLETHIEGKVEGKGFTEHM